MTGVAFPSRRGSNRPLGVTERLEFVDAPGHAAILPGTGLEVQR